VNCGAAAEAYERSVIRGETAHRDLPPLRW